MGTGPYWDILMAFFCSFHPTILKVNITKIPKPAGELFGIDATFKYEVERPHNAIMKGCCCASDRHWGISAVEPWNVSSINPAGHSGKIKGSGPGWNHELSGSWPKCHIWECFSTHSTHAKKTLVTEVSGARLEAVTNVNQQRQCYTHHVFCWGWNICTKKELLLYVLLVKPHRNVSSGSHDTSFEVILKRLMTYSGFRHNALRELLFGNIHIWAIGLSWKLKTCLHFLYDK